MFFGTKTVFIRVLCDAWLIAACLGNAKNRKGVRVHCCHGHSQVYRLYGGSVSVIRVLSFCLHNGIKALGGERPELTGSSLLPRCFFMDMRLLSEKFNA